MIRCKAGSCINNKNKECSLKDITIDGLLKCENYNFDMDKAVKSAYEMQRETRMQK